MLVRLTQTGVFSNPFSFFFLLKNSKFFAKFGPEKRIEIVSPYLQKTVGGSCPQFGRHLNTGAP